MNQNDRKAGEFVKNRSTRGSSGSSRRDDTRHLLLTFLPAAVPGFAVAAAVGAAAGPLVHADVHASFPDGVFDVPHERLGGGDLERAVGVDEDFLARREHEAEGDRGLPGVSRENLADMPQLLVLDSDGGHMDADAVREVAMHVLEGVDFGRLDADLLLFLRQFAANHYGRLILQEHAVVAKGFREYHHIDRGVQVLEPEGGPGFLRFLRQPFLHLRDKPSDSREAARGHVLQPARVRQAERLKRPLVRRQRMA